MKQKIVRHPIRSLQEYVRLWNGLFSLTDSEIEVLSKFIELHLQFTAANIPSNAFSTDGRKIVAERMGQGRHTYLAPYIKSLKDKGAITAITGGYRIDERLIPQGEHEIIIKIR